MVVCPASLTEITPPHVHEQVQVLVNAGCPLTITEDEPGVQGLTVTGMHGCGVSTPAAADVAAATCGLDGALHIPNGGMFTVGLKSCTEAASFPPDWTGMPSGTTLSAAGAAPNEHINVAVATT